MKSINKICLLLLLIATFNNVNAQDKMPSKEEQAYASYMTPGKMHDMLAQSTGVWNEEVTMWMAPDAPPVKSTMNVMNKMIMGNRYLQGMHRGSFNGKMFEGISLVGYDNAKKAFFNTWIDNMGTGMMTMEGQYNEATKSIEMSGKEVDPVSGKELKVREVMKFIDNDNHTLEMYMTPLAGKEYKNMEIKLTRRQMPVPSANPVAPTPVAPIKPAEKK